jgi:hypothetical protein
MRGAPPVFMACGPDPRWVAVERGAWTATAGIVVLWGLRHAGLADGWAALGAALCASLIWTCLARRPLIDQADTLTWDGLAWQLNGTAGEVGLMLDAGTWVLLRFHAHGGGPARWLSIHLARCGSPMPLCRAALHAHGGLTPPRPSVGPG